MSETTNSFTVTIGDGKQQKAVAAPVPEPASIKRTWSNGTQSLDYEATAECLQLNEDDSTLIGHMFALSYVTDEADKTDRPVTFLWNGGPGGSSFMVNVGGMGPRHVPIDKQEQLPCPTQPVDNPWTMLPFTDMVFFKS